MRRFERTAGVEPKAGSRSGVGTLDYVLVLGIILPLAAIVIPVGKRIIELIYEYLCVSISWPFL